MRSLRAAPLAALTTAALVTLVCAGAVAAVSVARSLEVSPAAAGVPALVGLVAVVELAARATAQRRGDLALARLRGRHGPALVGFALGPLAAAATGGALAGLAVGLPVARWLTRRWGLPWRLEPTEIAVAALVLLGALLAIAVVAAEALRRPLAESLTGTDRKRGTPVLARFLELVVVVGAVAAVYEARRGGGDEPVALLAPVLVGLAVGTVVGWLLELVTPTVGSGLGWFLATRRLRRDAGAASLLRVLVAAGVVMVVGLSALHAASDWRDTTARIENAGPVVYPVEQGALRAEAAARAADPDGRWLMAAVAVPDDRPTHRRVFVDSRRWEAVVGDFYAGTPVADLGASLARLAAQPQAPVLRADRVSATLAATTLGRGARLELVVVDDDGVPETLVLPAGRAGTVEAPLRRCHTGCTPVGLTLTDARRSGSATLSALTIGTVSVLDLGTPSGDAVASGPGLRIVAGGADLLDFGGDRPPLALSPPGVGQPGYEGLDGASVGVEQAGSPSAVPVFGTEGTVLDLPRALMGARGTVPSADAFVVARSDTPATVTAALRRAGVHGPSTTLRDRLDRLAATPQARAAVADGLVAGLVALIALVHLLAWTAARSGRRRTEAAALRVAGHRPAPVVRAYLLEVALLGAVVVVATATTCWAATRVLLEPLRLHPFVDGAPALDLGARAPTVLAVCVALAVVIVLVPGLALLRAVRRSRPAGLREVVE